MSLAPAGRTSPADVPRTRVRDLSRGETEPLLEVFEGLGRRSRELRFLASRTALTPADLSRLSDVDGRDHVALVAESIEGRPIGIARFVRDRKDLDSAEVAMEVVDAWQARGIGTLLASALVLRARQVGVRRLGLLMRPDNQGAARLLQHVRGDVRCLALDRESAEFDVVLTGPHLDRRSCERNLQMTTRIETLLGIWAHPDDEAYCSSGLMAQVREGGGRVVVVTASRGEHGTADPGTWPPARLGPLRERELEQSLAEVGVHDHRWLSHRDGELERVGVDAGAAELAPIRKEMRPDVIVTFGPDGM